MKWSACAALLLAALLWPDPLPVEEAPKEILPHGALVLDPLGRSGAAPSLSTPSKRS